MTIYECFAVAVCFVSVGSGLSVALREVFTGASVESQETSECSSQVVK